MFFLLWLKMEACIGWCIDRKADKQIGTRLKYLQAVQDGLSKVLL